MNNYKLAKTEAERVLKYDKKKYMGIKTIIEGC